MKLELAGAEEEPSAPSNLGVQQNAKVPAPRAGIEAPLDATGKLTMIVEGDEHLSQLASTKYRNTIASQIAAQTLHVKRREKFYKKVVFVVARSRPGEPQSSFLAEGLVQFLLGRSLEARELREKFIFKVVPMMNPDGVRLGSSRLSALGVDLDARWQKPSAWLHPEVYHARSLLRYLNVKMRQADLDSTGVVLFLNLAGSSKRLDCYVQGAVGPAPLIQETFVALSVPDALNRAIPAFNARHCRLSRIA